jgi:hypothetical protein
MQEMLPVFLSGKTVIFGFHPNLPSGLSETPASTPVRVPVLTGGLIGRVYEKSQATGSWNRWINA